MRIAFCGPSGSGKSTLALGIGEKINNDINNPAHSIIIYSRPTYAAKSLGYKSARDVPEARQSEFQIQCLVEQVRAQIMAGQNYVIDRTTLDTLAYLEYKMPYIKHTGYHQVYEALAVGLCKHEYIFYVPNFSDIIEDNGIRFLHGQEQIEEKFFDIFERFNINAIKLKTLPLEDRINEICEVIKIK